MGTRFSAGVRATGGSARGLVVIAAAGSGPVSALLWLLMGRALTKVPSSFGTQEAARVAPPRHLGEVQPQFS